MPEIARSGRIIVRVYCEIGSPHHLPHYHVQEGDEAVSVVSLRTMNVIAGPKLSRAAREVVAANLDKATAKWNELNA